eukprot:Skav222059  [mRNA]  locus=scaffold707:50574:77847:- [translate_table: standard]
MDQYIKPIKDDESLAQGIALTRALKENFFAVVVGIEVTIVGAPGTGKTLAVNKATAVLRGTSSVQFFRDFSDVANSVFRYQCSKDSTLLASECLQASELQSTPLPFLNRFEKYYLGPADWAVHQAYELSRNHINHQFLHQHLMQPARERLEAMTVDTVIRCASEIPVKAIHQLRRLADENDVHRLVITILLPPWRFHVGKCNLVADRHSDFVLSCSSTEELRKHLWTAVARLPSSDAMRLSAEGWEAVERCMALAVAFYTQPLQRPGGNGISQWTRVEALWKLLTNDKFALLLDALRRLPTAALQDVSLQREAVTTAKEMMGMDRGQRPGADPTGSDAAIKKAMESQRFTLGTVRPLQPPPQDMAVMRKWGRKRPQLTVGACRFVKD